MNSWKNFHCYLTSTIVLNIRGLLKPSKIIIYDTHEDIDQLFWHDFSLLLYTGIKHLIVGFKTENLTLPN